ncbi:hypothetical protein PSECIP111951_03440 [Pseudoalteromonas holothuriae]|uniref:Uncharacterized protein n=1 Tax=Pseudoalteromonas holothuriae TaxID=2963714 RepID=A0ABN8UTK4_9GAMM|nr:hypothetical protein [Pseudoalteromonas sp. CIP111951]CAH9065794.1 hypothetical protein PSECIP111951_03440 [Pseudoalteromonas sp. CIP111951]
MRTVDLSVNWLLYGLYLLGSFGLFGFASMLDSGTVTISVMCYALIGASIFSLLLALFDKRFVHIDRAGISYSLGLSTHYIVTEDIEQIQRKRFFILTVLLVKKQSGEVKSFYSWSLSEAGFTKAEQLLASK